MTSTFKKYLQEKNLLIYEIVQETGEYSEESLRRAKSVKKYFKWIIEQLLNSAFVWYEESCRSRRLQFFLVYNVFGTFWLGVLFFKGASLQTAGHLLDTCGLSEISAGCRKVNYQCLYRLEIGYFFPRKPQESGIYSQ